ncbi:hypothetical protein QFZ82_001480 [Streptomyces sp. V4I23]|uniref:hypothetical protein n=1 Tax=Streptomyces sp. V4I23 TaxID=3042282 RepID=UPI002788B867|nr:hypothetical protein [Streptomyces sp. V4I23]
MRCSTVWPPPTARGSGFRLAVISEPQPDPAARELSPDDFHALSTRIGFLFFVVEAPLSAAGSDE